MKLNYLLIGVFVLISVQTILAQTPDWVWAKNAGGDGQELATAFASDGAHNLYVAGYFFIATLLPSVPLRSLIVAPLPGLISSW